MFTRTLSLLFFISILSTTTFAQTWQQTQMHGGGYVTGIIPHPTDANISFARIDVSGVYKTSNGGENWESLTKNIIKDNHYNYYVRSFAIDETNTEKLYFLSGNAPYDNGGVTNEWFLWTSTNGGTDWNRVVSPTAIGGNGFGRSAGETVAISPDNADVLYIGGQPTYNYGTAAWNTNSGLHIYNLGTANWSIPTGINGTFDQACITKVQFAPNDSDVLYISAVDYTFNGAVSSNSGLWKYVISTATLTQLRVDEVHDFDFDATNASVILTTQNSGIDKSTDGGQTWEGLTQPFGYTYNYCVTAHPTESGHWFFGYWNGIYQSGIIETTDAGASYNQVKYNGTNNSNDIILPAYTTNNQPPGFANAISTIVFHPANQTDVYIGDWDGLFKATNATGTLIDPNAAITDNSNWTWTWRSQGIHNVVQVRVTQHPTETNTFYNCLADVGFYESTDAGASMIFDNTHPVTSIYGVQYAPSNPMIGYCYGDHYTGKGRLVKTTDGGASWLEPASNQQYTEGFFETNNSACITDVQISDADANVLIVGIEKGSMSNQVYRSDDGGLNFYAWDSGLPNNMFKTWTAQHHLIKDANGETFYAWYQNNLYYRHLNDANWQSALNPGASSSSWFSDVISDPLQANKIYATQFGTVIYQSVDKGLTWTTINVGTPRSTSIAISEGGRMAVLQNHNANSQVSQNVFVTYDSGVTWESLGTEGLYSMFSGLTFIGEETLIGWTDHTGSATISLAPAAPLATSLVSFEQECLGNEVQLSWEVESIDDLSYFEVEKATSDLDWISLGRVEALNPIKQYKYMDKTSFQKSYYRLKNIQKDGQFDYSKIIAANCTSDNSNVELHPNPVSNILNVEVSDIDLRQAKLRIYNSMGLAHAVLLESQNANACQLSTEHLSTGLYYLVVEDGATLLMKRFVVGK